MPGSSSANRQSLRSFLADLEQSGDLMRIREPVDPQFELSAYLSELAHGPAVLFESMSGHALPAVGNVLNSIARIARALGSTPAEMQSKIVAAIRSPLPLRAVTSAPCQEIAVETPDLGTELPVPHFFPAETGRYITAGAIVAKDTATGKRNLSFARLKLLGGNRAFIGIAPNHHLAVMARAAHARGEKLEIAVTIGNHPAVLIAAALYLGLGDDELEVAGALIGEPVEVVRCGSVSLDVPAHCEVVLEGAIDLDERHEEGPVSEFHGLYERYGSGAVVTFSRLTRRNDALFQVIQPGYHPEHTLIGGVAIAAGLARRLVDAGFPVKQVAVGHGGCGRLDAVVSLERGHERAHEAMTEVWKCVSLVKNVTIVDDDIDPWDATQVEWATATRMKADRDLLVVPGRAHRPVGAAQVRRHGGQARHRRDPQGRGSRRLDPRRAACRSDGKVRARLRSRREP